ncbi:MAG: methyltransferase domain-containing protein [Candidatus Rokubacteria bacterium]|nr:methyltransferase domain-containing protein [Candidatus Rokubacteria bacterium]MBI3826043.1 methyltransferase domain-containing protein [Candidatus Rokubacteria bacterium]
MLLDRVPVARGLTILDVGAGTGFLTVELAQRCGPDARIIAVDPWPAAMRRLRRKLEHLRLDNVVLLEQDAASLALPEASVDVVVSNLGVNNFENAGAVLGACYRAAKPGARLLLTTNLAGHMAELYEVYRATLVELGQSDRLAALEAHVERRGTVDSITQLLGRAGFEVVDVVTGSFRMRFADGTALLRHYFVRLGFVAGWKAVAAPAMVEETFAALERNLDAVATARGELALTIPMACFEARKATAAGP